MQARGEKRAEDGPPAQYANQVPRSGTELPGRVLSIPDRGPHSAEWPVWGEASTRAGSEGFSVPWPRRESDDNTVVTAVGHRWVKLFRGA